VSSERDSDAASGHVEVDYRTLSPEALRGVIESFVGREGTDYGLHEKSLEQKVADVMEQLERGTARITFEFESETINIVSRR